jgi:arsenate reductase
MNRCFASGLLLLSFSAVLAQNTESQPEINSSTIVFVCEHGSARSVIAAAHFNRLASEKGLAYRAVSRGKNPDDAIPASIKDALATDGMDVSAWKPKGVTEEDMRKAGRVVTLGIDLPAAKPAAQDRLLEWSDVPAMSQSYDAVRKVIVQHVNELVQKLAASKPQ